VRSLLLPLDCGVIETVKRWYHHLIEETQGSFQRQERPVSLSKLVFDMSLNHSFKYIAEVWDTVRPAIKRKPFS
jgi:hypothetical protein